MKLWFETKLEKFGGPLKDLCGPPEGRGPPVEKHWSKPSHLYTTGVSEKSQMVRRIYFSFFYILSFLTKNSSTSQKFKKKQLIKMFYFYVEERINSALIMLSKFVQFKIVLIKTSCGSL